MKTFPIQKRYVQGPDFMELTPKHLEEQLRFARTNNVSGFIIGHEWEMSVLTDLSFLPNDAIRGLHISFEGVQDISAINSFHQLEVLIAGYMSYPQSEIRLANFPQMRVLNINWNKHIIGPNLLTNVIRLDLWKYKPKSRDLNELKNLNKLVYGVFTQPGIDNLDGIENLQRLKELSVRNVRSLKRFFSDNRKASFPLESLECWACPHLDLDSIPLLPTLERISISQVGKRETLRYLLQNLPGLKTISFTQSELTDGNLEYFLEHPTLTKVIIDHKKHYSMKEKEIQKKLDDKRKDLRS